MQILYPLFFLMSVLFTACVSTSNCRELTGRWTTYEGQDLVFEPNGNALWLTKFGSQYDTVRMRFQYDCAAKPITLDLSDFQNGPHTGKLLFGIFDWSSDSSFRFRYEVGSQPTVRPQDFDMEQTQKFSWAPN
ncbi:MAG: hypothetical protein LH618_01865 [Saprospiraceae bacterium]|nr:hypothetical protein [Saprospiraceae bacterium]